MTGKSGAVSGDFLKAEPTRNEKRAGPEPAAATTPFHNGSWLNDVKLRKLGGNIELKQGKQWFRNIYEICSILAHLFGLKYLACLIFPPLKWADPSFQVKVYT